MTNSPERIFTPEYFKSLQNPKIDTLWETSRQITQIVQELWDDADRMPEVALQRILKALHKTSQQHKYLPSNWRYLIPQSPGELPELAETCLRLRSPLSDHLVVTEPVTLTQWTSGPIRFCVVAYNGRFFVH